MNPWVWSIGAGFVYLALVTSIDFNRPMSAIAFSVLVSFMVSVFAYKDFHNSIERRKLLTTLFIFSGALCASVFAVAVTFEAPNIMIAGPVGILFGGSLYVYFSKIKKDTQ
jgi:FtsH-binding integral membrane protein